MLAARAGAAYADVEAAGYSAVAPYDVHLVIANKDAEARAGAATLAADLDRLGIEVLLDDRQASPGVKFKDADLLGIPLRIVVSESGQPALHETRPQSFPVAMVVGTLLAHDGRRVHEIDVTRVSL